MTLPPERISIKRRRQEEPVETLFVEHDSIRDTKRRFTAFFFQRVQDETTVLEPSQKAQSVSSAKARPSSQTNFDNGIPIVRSTASLEENNELEKFSKKGKEGSGSAIIKDIIFPKKDGKLSEPTSQNIQSQSFNLQQNHTPRRFHLSRETSSILSPNTSGGIRKSTAATKPLLATFVERQEALFDQASTSFHRKPPIDRIIDIAPSNGKNDPNLNIHQNTDLEAIRASTKVTTNTFLKPLSPSVKKGQSITDHPSTWDIESDELADRLYNMALELDPSVRPIVNHDDMPEVLDTTIQKVTGSNDPDDQYVYDTYIRKPHTHELQISNPSNQVNPNFGLLIIDEEDEEFLQRYVDSDGDSEWESDDSNAENNPANDYPDDDDEFENESEENDDDTYSSDDEYN